MTTERTWKLLSVDDYLSGERSSSIKHEFVGGVVYAMVGASNRHNLIASRILVAVGSRLRGVPCEAFNSDTKIRLQFPTHVRFYYPDVSVVCRQNALSDPFQDSPAIVFEVLSHRTRRADEGEKKDAYLSLPSLDAYVLVEQVAPVITLYRRTEQGFVREVHEGGETALPLQTIGISLPLVEIYHDLEFGPECAEDA
jgi:Uma2 family endonuclease